MATSDTTKTNLFLKYLEQIFGNQQISQLSGAYDPMNDMPDTPTSPTAEMYLKSPNPDLQEIFSGLASGNLDSITAKQRLADLQADPNSGYNNVPVGHLLKDVDAVMKELNTPSTKKKDKYQEAGLPNPSKSYTDAPEMAPFGKKAAEKIIGANDLEKMYAASLNTSKRPKRGTSKGTVMDGPGVPSWMARSLLNMSPENLKLAQEDLAKSQAYQQKVQAAYLTGNAQNLANAGRTPYGDATLKNAAFLKSILGK